MFKPAQVWKQSFFRLSYTSSSQSKSEWNTLRKTKGHEDLPFSVPRVLVFLVAATCCLGNTVSYLNLLVLLTNIQFQVRDLKYKAVFNLMCSKLYKNKTCQRKENVL